MQHMANPLHLHRGQSPTGWRESWQVPGTSRNQIEHAISWKYLSSKKHFRLVQCVKAVTLNLIVEQKYMGVTLPLHDTLAVIEDDRVFSH